MLGVAGWFPKLGVRFACPYKEDCSILVSISGFGYKVPRCGISGVKVSA